MAEKEYIEREALIEKISKLEVEGAFTEALKNATLKTIFEEPAADVQEIRHGKWIISSDGYYPYCSECGKEPKEMSEFCPKCGAKMDKEYGKK